MNRSALLLIGMLLVTFQAQAVAPGTVAIYSNGAVERLVTREGDIEVWENERKVRSRRSPNPVVPPLSRESLLRGPVYRQTLSRGEPATLLNAAPGASVEFVMTRTDENGNQAARQFQCEFEGRRKHRVMGKLEAVDVFTCERFTVHRKLWHKIVKEKRVLQYSPRLRMVVDRERFRPSKGTTTRQTLVKLLSPKQINYANLRDQLARVRSSKKQ